MHGISTYYEGISHAPEGGFRDHPREVRPASPQYTARSRQRYAERMAQKYRDRAIVAQTPQQKAQAQNKVREWNAEAKRQKSLQFKPVGGNIRAGRDMASGLRRAASIILTEQDISSLECDARALGIPKGVLQYNRGTKTGFIDDLGIICVRGDVLPDPDSVIARDRMSPRAVLAHEYYGHLLHHPSEYPAGDWRDEYRASRSAAINAPNLSDVERRDLMVDAYDRAREAGVYMEYDEEARRIIYGY